MQQLFRDRKYFFIAFVLFIIVGAILLGTMEQGDAIFHFSDRRSAFGDWFFTYFTKLGEEYMYAVFAVLLLFINIRYAILIPITGFSVLVISYFTKSYFAMDRPKVYFLKRDLFDQIITVPDVDLYVGATSFPSGHTMSAFALYGILAFLLAKRPILQLLLFLIALLVGISRVYLVQHFFQDIYLGAIMGVGIALMLYLIQTRFLQSPKLKINQPLIKVRV